jgi:RNA polymerase sigma-B factor
MTSPSITRRSVRRPRASAAQPPAARAEIDVAAMDELVAAYVADAPDLPPAGRRVRRDAAVTAALPFAHRLARRYSGRGEPLDDLEQVAGLALVRSIDRYDPERGPFSAYAAVTVIGELRRHFRDTGWAMHVPRRMQEASLEVGRAAATLTAELSRAPSVGDLARHLDLSEQHVSAALQTVSAYSPPSLNAPRRETGGELGDSVGDLDRGMAAVDDRITVADLLGRLPERERRILTLRFYGNRTQADIAAELGISQMHVSRLITRALTWLREAMLSDEPTHWRAGPTPSDAVRVEVGVRGDGGALVLVVVGELDRDDAGRFRDRLLATVRRASSAVVVDLSRVPLIDAAGIAALQAGYEAARARGLRFTACRAPGLVRRSLLAAGLLPLLDPPPAGTVWHQRRP